MPTLPLRSEPADSAPAAPPHGAYRWYVVSVLVLVYVFNILDRQILSILAERIKADLAISDAQMGFLYGTAFAVFYALFGIPLGRLADLWNRTSLISIGLAFWSLMTALSGLARGFGDLAIARVGVGVGEASATPASHSLIADYFPAARRATALAFYSTGIFIGAGLGLGLGGWTVDAWDAAWAGAAPPLGLRGWQVAFFAVGSPGLLLSLWVSRLREPVRGAADGILAAPHPHPFREFAAELRAVLPPLTVLQLVRLHAGPRVLGTNLLGAVAIAGAAWLVTAAVGNPAQWISIAIGLYAAVSWSQALRLRDPVSHALIFRTRSLAYATLGVAFIACTAHNIGFWAAPFFIRVHGASETEVGLALGAAHALGGWVGVTLGGVLADRFRQRTVYGRLSIMIVAAALPIPLGLWMLTTATTSLAYALNLPIFVLTGIWIGPAISTIQDLVLPRMRATASAVYMLFVSFLGLSLGPYLVGRLSVALGDLRAAMLVGLTPNVLALGLLLLACRYIAADEASRLDRARAAGEPGL